LRRRSVCKAAIILGNDWNIFAFNPSKAKTNIDNMWSEKSFLSLNDKFCPTLQACDVPGPPGYRFPPITGAQTTLKRRSNDQVAVRNGDARIAAHFMDQKILQYQ
jgi:hypothetical protein